MSSGASFLGLPAQALLVYERRNQLLANNIANSDTPGFKARDIDFRTALKTVSTGTVALQPRSSVADGNQRHMSTPSGGAESFPLLYRVPLQNSLDGNTVENDIEQAAYAENSVRYQAAVRFTDGRAKSLLTAIRGE
ncbi:MAG TPA: flagellar basal body rod protein FlgB [Gammaproteobacteria bacterium]|nr:flagellar basal body rod protein FlgB [Gammaproteobacteria bacterium]